MPKRLEDTALHKHYGVNQKKDCQPINLGSNKVCVVSLTKFYKFFKLCLLNIIFEKIILKNEKCKWPKFLQFCEGLDKGLYGRFLNEWWWRSKAFSRLLIYFLWW